MSVGYADGFLRGLSNHSLAYFGDTPLALVGIVSMDTITLDVSDVPDDQLQPGGLVELIGDGILSMPWPRRPEPLATRS